MRVKVEELLKEIVDVDGVAHLTLIDPAKQMPKDAEKLVSEAVKAGTDGFMVGGSTEVGNTIIDETVLAMRRGIEKHHEEKPIILFPSGVHALSRHADAVFFMSMLNSRDLTYVIGNQMIGAPLVRSLGLESIPMAYLVIEPGGTVGYVGDAKLIPRSKPEIAVAYALAGEYLGMRFVYLEAGSGASEPVPKTMISAVRNETNLVVVVGGGIRSPEDAKVCKDAGAHILVTGSLVESSKNVEKSISSIIKVIK
ncbi:geranylgeranylglyceryl/heptaprenylglyceryl phosphate synthase [Methanosarcinales archaeon]|nr:MAG: geranylgeranylglyceryl/heptaprenylglyceryl phosphate synthase [Methanosarcinales archaeon]